MTDQIAVAAGIHGGEWSIQQIAKLAGTTSRTLRHYGAIGLLAPSRIGHNGYRYYDADALVRLQRILLLRELGLGLPEIGRVLDRETPPEEALATHLRWLQREQQRLTRQIASVEHTITRLREGERPMAENMFDGFDHTEYKTEVEQKWGADAYAQSDAWWRGLSADEKKSWQQRLTDLNGAWIDAAERGIDPAGDEAQALAARHVAWLRGVPGTPAAAGDGEVKAYVIGLADMYVADERFAANYGGIEGATLVRDALHVFAEASL